ncbi:NADPH-dependent FMN reductase [Paenibacillus curdlanolyticus YK9]|uniref:NADPH-dependent FMN reductase n=1 Tax=Paenibacillus curdlanolyticus YK9 TaxID=717606 RepID=E0IFS1_9BACL|nr:NAD(P)H-dependent oxidoreductase [Paenibacillus curdlanolyticus]EFM08737.1 NADPH-dependent FMN reductase [Paenibacillus curdlanolyticus YK9]
MKPIQVLAISGSLRQKSSNSALMQAIMERAPENMTFSVYRGVGDLPHFNPDIDLDEGPVSVQDLRSQLKQTDAVLICSPEYGNGVPGSLKNALDWIVSSGEFVNKPTAVITASPTPMGGDKAHASLLLTLRMINAIIVEEASIMIPQISLKLNQQGEIVSEELQQQIDAVLDALLHAGSGGEEGSK